jgi:putative membrane protein
MISSRTKTAALFRTTIVGSMFIASAALAADSVSHGDREFMEKAAQAGHTEVEASKLAQSKGSSADVKTFAATMIDDHTKVGDELTQLAASKNVKVPAEPSIVQRTKIKVLSATSGSNFDKRYADEIGVTAHQDTIALFQKEASGGADPDVKAFATKTLPSLNHHLEMAKTLQVSTHAAAK